MEQDDLGDWLSPLSRDSEAPPSLSISAPPPRLALPTPERERVRVLCMVAQLQTIQRSRTLNSIRLYTHRRPTWSVGGA